MDAYSSIYNSDSSSSSSALKFCNYNTNIESNTKPSIHSIRTPLQPKPMTKKPIAPLPPTPPKIYQVDSSNFKQVVQRLTSLPEFQPRRLQNMAPPPLNLLPNTILVDDHVLYSDYQTQVVLPKFSDYFGVAATPTLSPASLAWCSFLLQSPGTPILEFNCHSSLIS